MKKIGILTHYYRSKNIGGLLQSYALAALLNENQFHAEQIAFDYNFFTPQAKQCFRLLQMERLTLKKLWVHFCRLLAKPLRARQARVNPAYIQTQQAKMAEFEQFIPHTPRPYNDTNIAQADAMFDMFISGSDQVFASYLLPLSAYYGCFSAPGKKVIAYAASSDRKQFAPKAEKLFATKLARFNALSVREKTLKAYIERITDKQATVVLDPTFLLSPQQWLQIANPAPVPPQPYIFCYFLGGKSIWQRQVVQAYADTYGYQVIHLPYITHILRPADQYLKSPGRYDVGPREFVALINGAQCVFTDSFHGLAFSINFGKNFYVFDRNDQSGPESMNARITDTLATFGLTARHITDKNARLDAAPLDFTKAHQILAQEKGKSITWLLNALKD